MIYQVTGQRITDSPSALLAPAWVLLLAEDRLSGALPAGQPVTEDYMRKLAGQWQGNDGEVSLGLSGAVLQRLADYFAANGGRAKTDFTM